MRFSKFNYRKKTTTKAHRSLFVTMMLILTLCMLAACGTQPTTAPNTTTTAKATVAPTEATIAAPTPSIAQSTDSGVIGDYTVAILNSELVKDYKGNQALRVYFEFTNNSDKAVSFMFAVSADAFQNGVELESAILMDNKVDEDGNVLKEIKPGVTLTYTSIFALDDMSPVTVEVSDLFKMSDITLAKTFNLS